MDSFGDLEGITSACPLKRWWLTFGRGDLKDGAENFELANSIVITQLRGWGVGRWVGGGEDRQDLVWEVLGLMEVLGLRLRGEIRV